VISEQEMAKFSSSIESGIRQDIAKFESLGYNPADLILTHDGKVLFDPEEATDRLQRERWAAPKPGGEP
jgi:hypothetical protein